MDPFSINLCHPRFEILNGDGLLRSLFNPLDTPDCPVEEPLFFEEPTDADHPSC